MARHPYPRIAGAREFSGRHCVSSLPLSRTESRSGPTRMRRNRLLRVFCHPREMFTAKLCPAVSMDDNRIIMLHAAFSGR